MGRRQIRYPRYIDHFPDRHGKPRFFVRLPGFKRRRVPLPGLPWSEEFMVAYAAAMDGASALPQTAIGAARSKPGTVNALVASYFQSDAFTKALAPETQRMRRNILDRFRTEHGDKRVAMLQRQNVATLLKTKTPDAQKNWLKTLRGLMLFAIEDNYRADDPTTGVKVAKRPVKSRGHLSWGAAQIAAYRECHPEGSYARATIELLLNVAARRGDAHKLGRQHVKNGKLEWRPGKTVRSTGKVLSIRILPELQRALDALPSRGTALAFILNDYGQPFKSAAAFGNKFADWCDQAGLQKVMGEDGRLRAYRAHGLRKAACKSLAHAGCTAPEIMAVSGHSSLTQVQIYIDDVEQERMADAAMDKLIGSIRK